MLEKTMLQKAEEQIKKAIPDAHITFDDFKHDNQHFFLTVISATFKDAPLVQQHRAVMHALKDLIDSGELHAVKIKTRTP